MRTRIYITLFIVFLIIYFLQANFFTWFNLADIKPNLFVILVLFLGLFAGSKVAFTFGIIFGIYIDLFIGKSVGATSVVLGIIGLLGGYFDKSFSKDSRITIMVMVIISTAIYEIGIYAINILIMPIELEIMAFLKVLIIEILYNVILTIILYPLFQTFGYRMEEKFKENKILTRYF